MRGDDQVEISRKRGQREREGERKRDMWKAKVVSLRTEYEQAKEEPKVNLQSGRMSC